MVWWCFPETFSPVFIDTVLAVPMVRPWILPYVTIGIEYRLIALFSRWIYQLSSITMFWQPVSKPSSTTNRTSPLLAGKIVFSGCPPGDYWFFLKNTVTPWNSDEIRFAVLRWRMIDWLVVLFQKGGVFAESVNEATTIVAAIAIVLISHDFK